MKIEIETRFNIGDLVYLPGFDGEGYCPRKELFKVQSFELKYDPNTQNITVSYGLDNGWMGCNEYLCFASYEECEQWCEIENNNIN